MGREKLRRFRERVGWTQTELADELGVRQPTVARLESGAKRPSLELAVRYLDWVGRVGKKVPKRDRPTPRDLL